MKYVLRLVPLFSLLVSPIAAFADDEEGYYKLSPQDLQAQRVTLGVIGAVALVLIGFYLFRRWQTLRSGSKVEGGFEDD